jgi:uncharacterized protein
VVTRRRRFLIAIALLVVSFVTVDLLRPPGDQLTAAMLLTTIDGYQATGSPLFHKLGVRCRFEPSCSRYAEAVIRRDGALVGTFRTAGRLLRCGPWTDPGQPDPP